MTNMLTMSGKWISPGKWLASAGLHEMTRIPTLLTGSVRLPTALVRIARPCFHHLKSLCILICRYAYHTQCRLAKEADDLETWFSPPLPFLSSTRQIRRPGHTDPSKMQNSRHCIMPLPASSGSPGPNDSVTRRDLGQLMCAAAAAPMCRMVGSG